MLKHDRITIVK